MGLYVQNPNPNGFVRVMRKLYNNGLQFKNGYVDNMSHGQDRVGRS